MDHQVGESDFRLLPKFLKSKNAILNPQNNDQRSFGYAISYSFHPSDWRNNWSIKDRFIQHGLDKIKYPVHPEDIPMLENQLNIRINLFSFIDQGGYKRYSLYISKKYKPDEVNLLYWEGRFAWIKYMSRLFCDARKYANSLFLL